MKTQIPAPRVPLIDGVSGMMSREWFSYFANNFERLGGGNSEITIPEIVHDISSREDVSNKVTSWTATPTDVHYPSEKLVKDELDDKQTTLVSGDNIKTINSSSILGPGNIVIGSLTTSQVASMISIRF